jgi:hypothetical protein
VGSGAIVPLFPLSHVLLPGMPLPLHIFEQRYRDLVADLVPEVDTDVGPEQRGESRAGASSAGAAFGVVALRSGTEAHHPRLRASDGNTVFGAADGPDGSDPADAPDGSGGPVAPLPDVEAVGTMAEIIELEPNDDGTSDLLSVGSRRFRILSLLVEGKSYLRGEVEFLDEEDGLLDRGQDLRARELLDVYDGMLTRLAGRATGAELPTDANNLSYQIAARIPLPPADRQMLLCADTAAERLDRAARLLRREIALLGGTRSIAVSPSVLRIATGVN